MRVNGIAPSWMRCLYRRAASVSGCGGSGRKRALGGLSTVQWNGCGDAVVECRHMVLFFPIISPDIACMARTTLGKHL
uniref:Uncharacterized protein n=1 Tax=Parascaris univalens TaxID=6257 RepID=A0A915B1Y5_PARUN